MKKIMGQRYHKTSISGNCTKACLTTLEYKNTHDMYFSVIFGNPEILCKQSRMCAHIWKDK